MENDPLLKEYLKLVQESLMPDEVKAAMEGIIQLVYKLGYDRAREDGLKQEISRLNFLQDRFREGFE